MANLTLAIDDPALQVLNPFLLLPHEPVDGGNRAPPQQST